MPNGYLNCRRYRVLCQSITHLSIFAILPEGQVQFLCTYEQALSPKATKYKNSSNYSDTFRSQTSKPQLKTSSTKLWLRSSVITGSTVILQSDAEQGVVDASKDSVEKLLNNSKQVVNDCLQCGDKLAQGCSKGRNNDGLTLGQK